MSLKIKPASTDQRDRWIELFDAYAAFYSTTVSEKAREQVWCWIQDADEPFWCDLVSEPREAPFGLVQYQLIHRSLSGGRVCYLSDLYVDPAFRGRGAGQALIDHVMAFAGKRGIPNVRWLTQEQNAAARRLYDSYGPRSDFVLYSFDV